MDEKISQEVNVSDYRAELPIDFISEKLVLFDDHSLAKNPDLLSKYIKEAKSISKLNETLDGSNVSYRISGNYIYFPKESGKLVLVYESIMTNDDEDADDYGYPMIPDDRVFMLALQSYIEVQWFKMLNRAGKVTDRVLDEAKQTYAFNVGRYETHSRRLSTGDMETLSKLFRNIHQNNNYFKGRFSGIGSR
jgi:hypothetical protein